MIWYDMIWFKMTSLNITVHNKAWHVSALLRLGQSQASIDAKHVQADILYKEAIDKVGHNYGTVYMGSPHREGQGPIANPGPLGATAQGPPSSLQPSLLNLPGKIVEDEILEYCLILLLI